MIIRQPVNISNNIANIMMKLYLYEITSDFMQNANDIYDRQKKFTIPVFFPSLTRIVLQRNLRLKNTNIV